MSLRPSRAVADVASFKIHTAADGHLWCAEQDKEPVEVAETIDEFLDSPLFRKGRLFRVIATPSNSTLIARLYTAARVPVELCTPKLGLSAADLANPKLAILRGRSREMPVSVGGWHRMTPAEYPPYAIADALAQKSPKETLVRMLWSHPAAASWSFPILNDAVALAGVVAEIRDPRWFVDRFHPDRLSPLMRYMGLDPRTMAWALGRSSKPVGANDRAKLVLDSWYNRKQQPGRVERQHPRQFLWHYLSSSRSNNAELRASQMMLAFVAKTWLSTLVDRKKSEPLFQPEYFFHRPADAEAYKKHVKSSSK